jgi:hypothetical protein
VVDWAFSEVLHRREKNLRILFGDPFSNAPER